MAWLLWLGTLACTGPDPTPDGAGMPHATGDTATAPEPFEATCAVMEDNVLRVTCTAALDVPGPIRVELERDDGAIRVFSSPDPSVTHSVFVWGLRPSTSYNWRVIDETSGDRVEGRLGTPALPEDLAVFGTEISEPVGPPSAVEAVLIAPGCPGSSVLMVDSDGYVIWYQLLDGVAPVSGFIDAMTWTEDQTILVEVAKSTILEFDLTGKLLMRADRGVQFENFVHHELFKRDGLVYAIQSTTAPSEGVLWVVDGLYVFDRDGTKVDELSFADLYPRTSELYMLGGYWSGQFPGATDFSHTNSVYVDEAGDIWLSFRHLHAFAKFRGGPGTPEFGTLLWTVVGDPRSPIADQSDFTLVGSDPTFAGQHDVHPASDGTVLMLDNGFYAGDGSRGVRYALDETARTLTELESWDLKTFCPIQGSVRELPGGDVITTCTSEGMIREYGPSAARFSWQMLATCRVFVPVQFSRGIPIDL